MKSLKYPILTTLLTCTLCALPAPAATLFVDDDACPTTGTGTELDPYCSIQTAINAAVDTDEIRVKPGTYFEKINFIGKAITLKSTAGPDLTTIDATGLNDTVVRCVSGEGLDTVFDGFTITGGAGGAAGGMLIHSSSPTVRNCSFVGNTAINNGGGLHTRLLSEPIVDNCQFIANTAGFNGGGLISNFGAKVFNCLFLGNEAESGDGGGMVAINFVRIENCVFIGNIASGVFGNGGGVSFGDNEPTVINCIFLENHAASYGGGIFLRNLFEPMRFANCVLVGNTAGKKGNTIYDFFSHRRATLTNCIIRSHVTDAIQGFLIPKINYSNVEGGFPGTGNIDADPLFVDPDNGDFRLAIGSPCIDAGDNNAPSLPLTDLDGNARVQNCIVDMGAYETPPLTPSVLVDTDCDNDVDGADFTFFASCFNKSGNPPRTIGCPPWVAEQLDIDDDNDIDTVDFAAFASCYNKAGNPPRALGCPQN